MLVTHDPIIYIELYTHLCLYVYTTSTNYVMPFIIRSRLKKMSLKPPRTCCHILLVRNEKLFRETLTESGKECSSKLSSRVHQRLDACSYYHVKNMSFQVSLLKKDWWSRDDTMLPTWTFQSLFEELEAVKTWSSLGPHNQSCRRPPQGQSYYWYGWYHHLPHSHDRYAMSKPGFVDGVSAYTVLQRIGFHTSAVGFLQGL